MKPKHILVTGGAGFIGSNFIRWGLEHDDEVLITNLDLLTYAGNLESLADVELRFGSEGEGRYRFVYGNICDHDLVQRLLAATVPPPDAIVHFAAESHVDRSITGPVLFVETNVNGTLSLLEACRFTLARNPREFRFIHVSTDEVYGSLCPDEPPFTEATPLAPNNPYSASKAAADHLFHAYVQTFELPAIITRCSNNYGPYQFPEKLVPLMITRALQDMPLPVYGDGMNVRDWIHVHDHCEAVWTVLEQGEPGYVYNIGGETEVTNLDIVKQLLEILDKPDSLIRFVKDRPGHDRRYATNISRIREELGWTPKYSLVDALEHTVEWYVENKPWWVRLVDEAYHGGTATSPDTGVGT